MILRFAGEPVTQRLRLFAAQFAQGNIRVPNGQGYAIRLRLGRLIPCDITGALAMTYDDELAWPMK